MRGLVICGVLVLSGLTGWVKGDDPPAAQDPAPPPYSEVMEVTASRVEQPLLDAPVAVSVVDRGQIETTAADNYADLLRGLPGVHAVQTSASDVMIRSRGATRLTENSQLVLLDGRTMYNDYSGYVIWDFLPVSMDELEAVDVVRGPGSSVWGANARSGVIQLRTRPPRDLQGGYVTASAGERGARGVTARWGSMAGPWSYKISGGWFQQDPWPRDNLMPDGSPVPFGYVYENHPTRQPKLDGRMDRDFGEATLSLRGGYSGTQGVFHSGIGPFQIEPGSHVDYVEGDYTRGGFTAKAYWNHLNGDAPNILNGLPFAFENHTIVLEAGNRTLVGGRHMLVYGGSARHNEFDLSIAPNHHARRDAGLYLEDIFELTKSIEINAGMRLDYFATLGTVVSPRLSVIVKPASNHALRFAANRAYRAPTLVENYLDTAVPNAIFLNGVPFVFFTETLGNEEIREESVDALEIGWSWRRGPLFLTATVYRNTSHDIARFLPVEFYGPADPPPGWPYPASTVPPFALVKTFRFLNVGNVREEGIELSADGRFRRGITVRAAYAYQFDPIAVSELPGVPLDVNSPPRHEASLSGERRTERWFASASAAYTGRAFWNDTLDPRFWGYTDAYTYVNAAFGFSATPKTQLVLSATNLLDRRIKQHVFGDVIGRKTTLEVRQRF